MKQSLMLILERARTIMHNALTHAINETALPAYLIEGILLDLLAEVRAQKAAEFSAEYEEALKLYEETLKLIHPPEPSEQDQTVQERTPTESEE